MRFAVSAATVVALATAVLAQEATDGFDQIIAPVKGQNVPVGKPFTISWLPGAYSNDSITVTIDLLQGATPESLQVGPEVASGVPNKYGSFKWNVPDDAAGFATYGLRITHDDINSTSVDESKIFQYSFPFHLTNGTASGGATTTILLGTGTAYTPSATASSATVKNTTVATPTPVSNVTLATTITTARPTSTSPSSTGSAPSQQSSSAAVANALSGSVALIGGALLALAL